MCPRLYVWLSLLGCVLALSLPARDWNSHAGRDGSEEQEHEERPGEDAETAANALGPATAQSVRRRTTHFRSLGSGVAHREASHLGRALRGAPRAPAPQKQTDTDLRARHGQPNVLAYRRTNPAADDGSAV